ncbi:hypothetical protein [Ferrimonas gelatinilytica]|uniref:Uncharacterized protein n=1 Tax=Ferrimonas gelatinilytica TaxID=1255257 RepID=A0ABP9S6Y6_9GAMM
MKYSCKPLPTALAITAALVTPLTLAATANFNEGTPGNLGSTTFTDANSGITAIGMYQDPVSGNFEPANLYRRNQEGDRGFGVCSPVEVADNGGDCPGPDGGGDINELSNQATEEFIYLGRPADTRWVSVELSSLDDNDGSSVPEAGQLWWDTNDNPNDGGLTLLLDFQYEGGSVEVTLDVAALGGADAPYLVLRPFNASNAEEDNNDYLVKAATIERGGQGCTPGYWKQPHHFDSWVMYGPDDLFSTAFGSDLFGDMTLLEVLQQGGGQYKALGRHAVAALLNASSGDVSYKYSAHEVISAVQGVNGNVESLKNGFAYQNEMGCPLN